MNSDDGQLTTLIGLPLSVARMLLAAKGVEGEKLIVHETVPPRADRATGEWRVLRCPMSEEGNFEIIAAREQVREEVRAAIDESNE
jgi:hypothetical protein